MQKCYNKIMSRYEIATEQCERIKNQLLPPHKCKVGPGFSWFYLPCFHFCFVDLTEKFLFFKKALILEKLIHTFIRLSNNTYCEKIFLENMELIYEDIKKCDGIEAEYKSFEKYKPELIKILERFLEFNFFDGDRDAGLFKEYLKRRNL